MPLNPYMLGAVGLAALYLFWRTMKKPGQSDESTSESDPYAYGHAPGGDGGGGGGMGLPLGAQSLGQLEGAVQTQYDGTGYPDYGDAAPSSADVVSYGPGGTQAPGGYIGAVQAAIDAGYSGYVHPAGQYETLGQTQPTGPAVYSNEPGYFAPQNYSAPVQQAYTQAQAAPTTAAATGGTIKVGGAF